MRTAAILPVKHFAVAKQRLAESVSESLREDLARAMVCDVLDALRDTPAVEQTIVVTGEQSVAHHADQQGAIVLSDTANDGQSAAVMLGIERALALGIERVLCVPGDCPALDPGELAQLLGAVENQPEVVIVPDRHGTGTNGLLLAPPDVISPSFGPGSYERHCALAATASWRTARPASLLLDIDTGEDLTALRARLSGELVRAPRTRAVLGLPVRMQALPTTASA
ncbi:MAG: 2-phospho-L-lactate guanylyltransferase [Solirubrobacterales bacterium]